MRGSGRTRRGLVLGFLAIVGTSAWAALATGSGTGVAAAAPVLDHFECYSATSASSSAIPTPFSVTPPKVLLKNKFASGGFVASTGAVQTHCNPAQKTAVQGGHSVTTPITNPDAHLLCRAITSPGLKLPASVTMKNQFGTGALKPTALRSLCVPSFKSTVTPPKFPPALAPANLDIYACYAVTKGSGPSFKPPATVKLKDQYGIVTTKLGAASTLCLPTSQTVNPYNGASKIVNPDKYSICFAIPATKTVTTRTVYDKNVWGIGTVTTTRNTQLCVPSTKVGEPPPSTTTTVFVPSGIVTNYSYPAVQGPYDIAAGSDGALWFSNYYGNSIGRIATDGTITNFPHASIVRPDGVEMGPDGAMYYANTGNSTIGRVTPDGVFSSFNDGRISSPYRVGAGPSLVTWFTNSTSSSVGWVAPNGEVNVFYDSRIQNPQGITAGPDGNMWFANFYGASIGRVKTDGTITIFTDAKISYPLSITAGPDGALWYTSPGNDSIGRITTDGKVTAFTNTTVRGPIDIIAGSDGALWFTNYSNNTIGRITTDGVISNFFHGTMYQPNGIAAGPDGAIWYVANSGSNSIGRITVGSPTG